MKANFALYLSHDGIELFHRAKAGWTSIGVVPLDDADLSGALDVLRRTAAGLEPGGLATKLVIPDSQILYTELAIAAAGDTPEAEIRAALQGRTPYEVGDLVFDWRPAEGGRVALAVVARETLAEAEAFAVEHRFNPVAFVGAPQGRQFEGEPWFGPAPSAADLLATAGPVERDQRPVTGPGARASGDDGSADATAPAQPAPAPAIRVADAPESVAATPAAAAVVATEGEAGEVQLGHAEALDLLAVAFASRRAAGMRGHDPVDPSAAARREPRPAPHLVPVPGPAAGNAGAEVADGAGGGATADAKDAPQPDSARPPAPAVSETGEGAEAAGAEDARPATGLAAGTGNPEAEKPPAPAARSPVAGGDDDLPPSLAGHPYRRPALTAVKGSPAAGLPPRRATPELKMAAEAAERPANLRRLPPAPPRLRALLPAQQPGRPTPVINFGPRAPERDAARRQAAEPPHPLPRKAPPPRPAATAAAAAPARSGAVGSRMVLAVMTLALLVLLGGLAVWSTFWADPGPGDTDLASAAPLPGGTAELPGPAADPAPTRAGSGDPAHPPPLPEADLATAPDPDPALDPEAASDLAGIAPGPSAGGDAPATDPLLPADPEMAAGLAGMTAADLPEDLPGDMAAPVDEAAPDPATGEVAAVPAAGTAPIPDGIAAATPDAATAPAPETPALPSDPQTELVATGDGAAERVAEQLAARLTPELAEELYSRSGVWVLPPAMPGEPRGETTDDLYVAAVDTEVPGVDAVALDPPPRADAGMPPQMPPPPEGTTFDFDANGLVRATSEGALTPEGILVTAGRPPLVPPPRPGAGSGAAEPAPAPPAAAVGAEGQAGETLLPMADPPPPLVRPHWRPDDLTELNEKANLGGMTRVEFAMLKPRLRPAEIVAAAAAARNPAPSDAEIAAAETRTPELVGGTRLAVAVSPLPRARPGDFARLVAAAVRPEKPAPVPDAGAADRGKIDPDEADNEVEVAAAAMPGLPTRANVAKTATIPNALTFGKLNLIGVFGTSSQRRALVLLSSGKYVKVEVGDRLDGGRVAAIGDSQLIYVKGGRQIRLDMPKKT